MKIRYLDAAQIELDEAFAWYEAQHKGLGNKLINEIQATINRICLQPNSYVKISTDVQRALVKRFPYGVLFGYDAADESIVIVAIAHLHRKPLYWLNLNRQSF